MHRILLVEDEQDIGRANQKFLSAKGYYVALAQTGSSAKALLEKESFDCVILDILLPDDNGLNLCKELRKVQNVPVLFLSCLDQEEDVLKGLISGGDDYMTKPFSLEELEARITVLIRRSTVYNFRLDKPGRALLTPSGSIQFSVQEFDLLLLLLEKDEVVTEVDFQQLFPSSSNGLAVYIRRLRQKLEPIQSWIGAIETVRGEGYRLRSNIALK